MSASYVCVVCGSSLRAERVDDGFILYDVDRESGTLTEIVNKSNGHSSVVCVADPSHPIPNDLYEDVMDALSDM